MKKKYIICIITVAILLIGTSIFFQIMSGNSNEKDDTSSDFPKPVFTNEVTGRHCIEKLCIDTLSIEYLDDNSGFLWFMLVNTDEVNVQMGGNFVLTPDTSTPLSVYFDEIQPHDSNYVKVDFSDKKVTEMKDYILSDLIANGNEEV